MLRIRTVTVFTLLAIGGAGLALADPNSVDPNFACVPPILDPNDCNGNGVPDGDDIASGTTKDRNFNGVPDECEFCMEVSQASWVCPNFTIGQRFSSTGVLLFDGDPDWDSFGFGFAYANAVVDGRWVIRNMPLLSVNQDGPQRNSVGFNLGNTPGVKVTSVAVSAVIGPVPLAGPPTTPPVIIPVCEVFHTPSLITPGDPNDPNFPDPNDPNFCPFPTPDPNFADPNTGGGPNVPKRVARRRNMEGVDEPRNHCAPGAAARSLSWMNKVYCLGLPAACDSAQELHDSLKNLMRTSLRNGTSIGNIVRGIQRIINQKMLGNCLTVTHVTDDNPCTLFDAVAGGKDVIGIIFWKGGGGHAIAVNGAVKCGNKVTITFRDDAFGSDNQGDGKADSGEEKSASFERDGNGGWRLRGLGSDNSWGGFIAICPTKLKQAQALGKWLEGDPNDPTGDPNDPIVEGVIPRLERYAFGDPAPFLELLELKLWATNALDVVCYLLEQALLSPGVDPQVIDDLFQIKQDLFFLRVVVCELLQNPDPFLFQEALNLAYWAQMHLPAVLAAFDCDGNGIDDAIDIANGTLTDSNGNGIPDECDLQQPCPGDVNGDGVVNITDLGIVLANFGQSGPSVPGDVNGDGTVNITDLGAVLAAFGQACP